jgi:hypothetical protein
VTAWDRTIAAVPPRPGWQLLPAGLSFPPPARRNHTRVMNSNPLLLISELALVIAGVFVFRGLWMLLDMVDFMRTPLALWVSLLAGTAISVWAFHCILKHKGK